MSKHAHISYDRHYMTVTVADIAREFNLPPIGVMLFLKQNGMTRLYAPGCYLVLNSLLPNNLFERLQALSENYQTPKPQHRESRITHIL